jgi:hypothetical protein
MCALALIHTVAPCNVYAEDLKASSPETTVMTDKARELYEDGLVSYKKSKWLEARASFLAAWSLNKHWQIAGNLADCEFELGKFRDAAEHAAYYLDKSPADRHPRAEELLNKVKARIVALTVTVDPPGADVLIDDVLVGRAPLPASLFVDPGARKVTARLAGRPDVVKTLNAAAGTSELVKLTFPLESNAFPPPGRGPSKVILASGTALAGVALGTGVVLTILSAGKASDADTQLAGLTSSGTHGICLTHVSECNSIDSARRARDSLAKGATASFIGSGAVGLATLGYFLLTPKDQPRTGIKVIPALAAGYGGISVVGAW